MLADPAFELRSLGALARALSVSLPLNALVETAAEEARVALRAASVSISRLEPNQRALRTLINVGDLGSSEVRWPLDESYPVAEWKTLAHIISVGTAQTSVLTDENCHPETAALLTALGKGSSVASGIRVDGTIWGEFYATRRAGEEPFTEDAVDYVNVLSAILGAALSRSLRETELAYLAFHDPLTGVLNRRGISRAAELVFELAEGASRVVATVALDINGLKRVNDERGHAHGDELIATAARAIAEAFASYQGSVTARVGGDEFIVLVSDHDPSLVAKTVDVLCRRTSRGWAFGPDAGISAGTASALLTGRADVTYDDLLTAADRALYVAKQSPLSAAVVSQELTAGTGAFPDRRRHDRRKSSQT